MKSRKVKVRNQYGIHVRPSSVILTEIVKFKGTEISLDKGDGPSVMCGMMELIAMGLECGADVTVIAEGPQEQEACDKIAELLEFNFDFPKQ